MRSYLYQPITDFIHDSIAAVSNTLPVKVVLSRASEIRKMLLGHSPPLDLVFPVVDFLENPLCVVRVVSLYGSEVVLDDGGENAKCVWSLRHAF
ncbi:hypothetical protein [Halobacterium sp. KA-6]|uniref:hypothetical protein n=1 Tax=Halobacterium sp. KA-6 TaxID=2896368 RepID=UPI001E5A00ED|nr:hypothetical protein [Halobacterium sp. KA-6]MCD2202675.1 hypothetical protein [Halobacterium sp. KA-6]